MSAKHLHFLGITGHAMRGIALAAREMGAHVTGTDEGAKPPGTVWLDAHKITWWANSDVKHLEGVDQVIMSGATPVDNVELVAAGQQGIPILPYAAFVGKLAEDKRRIVVAGTHGKTTTTAFLTWILESGGKQPDFLVGIQPRNFESSVRLSRSKLMVLEGDEYKSSTLDLSSKFCYYRPDVLIGTSLEMDHPDLFKSVKEIEVRFEALMDGMSKDGKVFYWAGSEALGQLARNSQVEAVSYGQEGTWHTQHTRYGSTGIAFDLYEKDVYQGHFAVPLFGAHNVDNATAAIAVALGEGLTPDEIQVGCESFLGAARRFEIVSKPHAAVTVIDDYAHHPTEIAATINAARVHFNGRVIAIVRPHTYSRTKELLQEYRSAVQLADLGFIASIEGAREASLAASVSGADIAIDNPGVEYTPDRNKLVDLVCAAAKPGDVVLSMTVSGYEDLAQDLAQELAVKTS